jgi:hypothetical protein
VGVDHDLVMVTERGVMREDALLVERLPLVVVVGGVAGCLGALFTLEGISALESDRQDPASKDEDKP